MSTAHQQKNPLHSTCCPCRSNEASAYGELSRRAFLQDVGGAAALLGVAVTGLSWSDVSAAEQRAGQLQRRPIRVKPILVHSVPKPRPQRSWRNWGGIQTQEDAAKEIGRIRGECAQLESQADFPVRFLDPVAIQGANEVDAIRDLPGADVLIVYAAGGGMDTFDKLAAAGKDMIFFCRHKSGPVYLWYEIISPRYLRQHTDSLKVTGLDDGDVVIDSQAELLWRLRALCGLRNTLGTRIIAVGGPGAWAQPKGVVPKLVGDICRSQIDIRFDVDSHLLAERMPGFHWMTCYGDYRREIGYAIKKVGIAWDTLGVRA